MKNGLISKNELKNMLKEDNIVLNKNYLIWRDFSYRIFNLEKVYDEGLLSPKLEKLYIFFLNKNWCASDGCCEISWTLKENKTSFLINKKLLNIKKSVDINYVFKHPDFNLYESYKKCVEQLVHETELYVNNNKEMLDTFEMIHGKPLITKI